jgi:protocatechuate 3,4-dioxygenase beta subunit
MPNLFRHATLIAAGVLAGCSTLAAQGSLACVPTEADSMGPFYVSDTPVTNDLHRHGKSGDPLTLKDRIRSADGHRPPLGSARIEIWQTDGDGDYHPDDNGAYSDYADEAIDLRGTVVSDENGEYSVKTLVPGAYFPRPRHFHYRITAPDHVPLVTQLYITGDGILRQPGGDCRHAALQILDNGFLFEAPDLFLVKK